MSFVSLTNHMHFTASVVLHLCTNEGGVTGIQSLLWNGRYRGGDACFEGDLLGEQVAHSWSGFGWRATAGWGVSLWVNTLRNEVSVAVTLRLLCLLFPGIKDPIVFSLSISVNTGEWHGPARSFYMVAVHDFTGSQLRHRLQVTQ